MLILLQAGRSKAASDAMDAVMEIKAWHAMELVVRKLWACMPYLRILLVNEIAQLLSQMLLLIICDSTAQQCDISKRGM